MADPEDAASQTDAATGGASRRAGSPALGWVSSILGKKRRWIYALVAVQAAAGALGVVYALLLRGIVDSAAGGDVNGFWLFIALTLALIAVQLGLQAVNRWLSELSRATYENILKGRLFSMALGKDYASVAAIHSGEWMNRLTSDTMVVARGAAEVLPGFVGMAVKLVAALAMIIAIDPRFALILIPAAAGAVVLTYAFRKVMKRLHRDVQERDGRLRVFMQERIESSLVLRMFAAQGKAREDAAGLMDEHLAARMRKNRFSNLCNTGFSAGMRIVVLFGVGYCCWGIMAGTVSYGTLVAIMQLISQIQSPFANIAGYIPRYYAMEASAERLMEAESMADDIEGTAIGRHEAALLYESLDSFGLEDATFSYGPVEEGEGGGNVPAIEGLSLEIRKGDYIAFTGHSGCGKSTTLKVLMGLYGLDEGCRYLQVNGERTPLTSAHRGLFAYVPQDNQLMQGTIRESVCFAEPGAAADEGRLRNALEIACADEFVYELEHGPDTPLGERGAGLSEGQMQRLAIARAAFSDRPILLFDESTSALDGKTEGQVLLNLRALTDKTVIIVTHRPAALEICDRVLHFTESGVEELASSM